MVIVLIVKQTITVSIHVYADYWKFSSWMRNLLLRHMQPIQLGKATRWRDIYSSPHPSTTYPIQNEFPSKAKLKRLAFCHAQVSAYSRSIGDISISLSLFYSFSEISRPRYCTMAETHELGNINSAPRPLGEGTFSIITAGARFRDKDENTLARLGKKQVLKVCTWLIRPVRLELETLLIGAQMKRRFGFLSLFGFSCTILITWETALA